MTVLELAGSFWLFSQPANERSKLALWTMNPALVPAGSALTYVGTAIRLSALQRGCPGQEVVSPTSLGWGWAIYGASGALVGSIALGILPMQSDRVTAAAFITAGTGFALAAGLFGLGSVLSPDVRPLSTSGATVGWRALPIIAVVDDRRVAGLSLGAQF